MPENKKDSPASKITSEASLEADTHPVQDDEMTAEEQAAFEKIMGEIGDSEDANNGDAADAKDSSDEQPEAGEDDFAAELKKVAQAADTADETTAASASGSTDDDELDEDQQKAFESIMAQIEGGGDAANADAADAKDSSDEQPEAGEDDSAAELEKVAQSADIAQNEEPAADIDAEGDRANAPDPSAAAGNKDSQHVEPQDSSDDKRTQIEGDPSEKESSEDHPPEKAPEQTGKPYDGSPSKSTPAESEDISADIEDILTKVTVEDEQSPSSDEDAVEIAGQPTPEGQADGETEKTQDAADPTLRNEGERLGEEETAQEPSSGDAASEETPSEESQAAVTFHLHERPDANTSTTAVPLREATPTNARPGRKIAVGASCAAIVLLFLVAYFYWPEQVEGDPNPTATRPPKEQLSQTIQPEQSLQPPLQVPADVPRSPEIQPQLKTIAAALEQLRAALLSKQKEIEELRTYYKAGIDTEIQGIVRTVSQWDAGKATHATAMNDPQVSLGMAAIQRRDRYMRKLAVPTERLHWASEELLYYSRKAKLLALMASRTSDIDIDRFIGQAEEVIDRHTRALTVLNIDAVQAEPLPTKTIWKDIAARLSENRSPTEAVISATDSSSISKNICSGNYTQKHKLSELTAETARCLAKWKGKDLFLNELKTLRPEAARQLAAWEGEWLGLNGLVELSPEAAAHLARWKGRGLSLNGLTKLSPRVVAILSEWQGQQIELVNVKHMAHWDNSNTRLFLSEELVRKRNTARN